jgi:transposase-like protein
MRTRLERQATRLFCQLVLPIILDDFLAVDVQNRAVVRGKRKAVCCIWEPEAANRPVQYLNNIIEQDHRAIKRRVNAKQGFREFQSARRTIQGYEAINILRKGQVRWLSVSSVQRQNRFINELFEVAA